MQVMYRTQITLVGETSEAVRIYTDAALKAIAAKRDEPDTPLIVGCEAFEDNYLITESEDLKVIEDAKVAFELVKQEPVTIAVSAVKDSELDLSRVKVE